MQENFQFIKPILIILASIVAMVVMGYFIYNALVFRITSIDPEEVFPTSTEIIIVSFNHTLAPKNDQPENLVVVNPDTGVDYMIDGKTIIIRLLTPPQEGIPFELRLNGVVSSKGKVLSREFVYEVRYVPFSNLSSQQRDRQVEQSDSFESDFPLVKELPIRAIEYTVTYRFPDSDKSLMPIIISVNFDASSRGGSGPTQADMDYYISRIRDARTEALDRLRSLGYTDEKYEIFYSENFIIDEFPGSYLRSRNTEEEFDGSST